MYPQNYAYTVGQNTYYGVYVNPINDLPYTIGQCNYSPNYPCFRSKILSQTVIESRPYNPKEFGTMNKIANFLSDLVAGQNAEVLATVDNTAITLTNNEIAEILADFRDILIVQQN